MAHGDRVCVGICSSWIKTKFYPGIGRKVGPPHGRVNEYEVLVVPHVDVAALQKQPAKSAPVIALVRMFYIAGVGGKLRQLKLWHLLQT